MSAHATKAISVADKVVALSEDGLRGIDRTIAAWPAEFRSIIWDAVADIASRRAEAARALRPDEAERLAPAAERPSAGAR